MPSFILIGHIMDSQLLVDPGSTNISDFQFLRTEVFFDFYVVINGLLTSKNLISHKLGDEYHISYTLKLYTCELNVST
jgi:hypothetical protein